MDDYPAPPWSLRGEAWLSCWTPRLADLPELAAGLAPLRIGGRGLAFTAWVDYDERGQLAYRELLLAVAIRRGPGVAATITSIWVDSPASMHGARSLWSIPKQLADFDIGPGSAGLTARATGEHGVLAGAGFVLRHGSTRRGSVRRGSAQRRLTPRLPARFSVYQDETGAPCPVRVSGRPDVAAASWWPEPDSPLGFLAGYRPLVSLRLRDLRMRFG